MRHYRAQPIGAKILQSESPSADRQALSLGGFAVVSQANNHAMDFGSGGLTDTQTALRQYGIATVGRPGFRCRTCSVIIQRNGLRMAFLAYVDVMPEKSGFDPHSWAATATSPEWPGPIPIRSNLTYRPPSSRRML